MKNIEQSLTSPARILPPDNIFFSTIVLPAEEEDEPMEPEEAAAEIGTRAGGGRGR